MKKYFLVHILLSSTFFTYCQTISPEKFSKTQKCVYDFIRKEKIIPFSGPDKAQYYFLEKDSFVMFQRAYNDSDTLMVQIHLVSTNKPGCTTGSYRLDKKEFILRSIDRMNPVFLYRKYYESFDPFDADYAAAKKNGRWGFINEFGNVIVPFQYTEIKPHAFGLWLKNDNGTRLYDLDKKVESKLYDFISTGAPRIDNKTFIKKTRYTPVKRNGKAGMIDINYTEIIPLIYNDIKLLRQKFIVGSRNNKVVLIEPVSGKEISRLYDKVTAADDYFLEAADVRDGKNVIVKIDAEGKEVD